MRTSPALLALVMLTSCGGRTLADSTDASDGDHSSGAIADGAPSSTSSSVDGGQDAADATLTPDGDATTDAGTILAEDANSSSIASSFQLNVAHTGASDDPELVTPLTKMWDVDLGGLSAYPLIADGHVYVVATTAAQAVVATALDARTGGTIWGPIALGPGDSASPMHAYDAGRLFVLTWSGALTALDAETGDTLWTIQIPGQAAFYDSPPTAYAGLVYVGALGVLSAIDEATGTTRWTADVGSGDYSAPAVSANGVYVSYAGPQVYAVAPNSGASLWHYSGPASGGGGETPVLFGGALYLNDLEQPLVLNAATGAAAGTFMSSRTPAFHGARGFFVTSLGLEAHDLATGAIDWTYPDPDAKAGGDDTAMTSPLVVNGRVYEGFLYFRTNTALAAVAAFDEATGALVWWDDLSAYFGNGEDFGSYMSMSAAGGVLVVPAMNHLLGYATTVGGSDP